jgi:demethylsterigmatocystin 6-O-methyltransferase
MSPIARPVFQLAYKTDLDTYTWFSQNPKHLAALIKYMALEQNVRGRWLDEYPIKRDTQGWDPDLPVFVDVSGNVGHYCAMFKNRFPNVPGSVILQDLPNTLTRALQTPGVEPLAHNFFEPQPVKGELILTMGHQSSLIYWRTMGLYFPRCQILSPRMDPSQLE